MGAGLELFALRKDGAQFPVEISLSPLETEEGLLVASAIRDITPRKQAEAERNNLLKEQAAQAEASRIKDEFLATLSHELRTSFLTLGDEDRLRQAIWCALEVAESFTPDVIVSDIAMPDEDGYAFLHRLRQSRDVRLTLVPTIALTAHARAEDRARALAAGFQQYVSKPVHPERLVGAVARAGGRTARP